jgi:predicted phage terminase large subunit-like protein
MYDRLDFGPTMAAVKACHARFPQAHAVLIEDKANGPAIISELRKEIAGVVAVNPEGGKLARAQATAPLWEAGSIELPDPQIFGITWMEDYLHNICTFPKAAHDDDVDATSQALIYMRSRLGGGIVEFYRQQATGEVVSENASASNRKSYQRGPQAPGSPERAAFVRAGVEAPPPAQMERLARNLLDALEQGTLIQCNEKQYPEVRAVLSTAAARPDEQEIIALLAQNEIDRLDQMFNRKQLPTG